METIDRTYGRRSGAMGGSSVNGTAVLADMFDGAGHKVVTRRALTPSVHENADVIVWFPDDMHPPSTEVINWLDGWLWAEEGRKLIYVGRDFDAGPLYWDKVIPGAPAGKVGEMKRRRNNAVNDFLMVRAEVTTPADSDWFRYDPTTPKRQVRTLAGPWAEGIDATAVEIELEGTLDPHNIVGEDVLLESNGDVLVARYDIDWSEASSRILFVANGSFLLNLPLVNHEHRKLAGRLVDEAGEPEMTVVFLESGEEGPKILLNDPSTAIPSGLAVFGVWPLNVVLVHFAVLLLVLSMSRWPIFGRPRRISKDSTSDFGKHIDALGELLQKTADSRFARARLEHFQQQQHRMERHE